MKKLYNGKKKDRKMTTNSKKTRESLLKKELQTKKYYCPHCKILFKKNLNEYTFIDSQKKNPYKCSTCKTEFSRHTYTKDKIEKSGKHYSLIKDAEIIKKDVREHIYKDVTLLWQDGYTIDEIHLITHFSKKLIREKITEFKQNNVYTFSVELFKDILDHEFIEKEYNLIPADDIRTHKIRKALDLGCSVSQIATILGMSNTTISKARRIPYIVKQIQTKNKKEEKKAIDRIQTPNKEEEKVIDQIQTPNKEEEKAINIFLQRAINITDKKSQRRIVTIEDNKVTIKGMTKERKDKFIENYKKNIIILSPHTD